MIQHFWLNQRAMRIQHLCFCDESPTLDNEKFPLYLRYQTTHDRAFFKALNELPKLRKQRIQEQIGFERQKASKAAQELKAEQKEEIHEARLRS